MEQLAAVLQAYFARYGYWTIAVALLLENAGVPVPGETVLLFASFLASSQHHMHLPWIFLIGTVAAAAGDNIGYAIGRWGGRWLLDRYRSVFCIHQQTLQDGERLFEHYGPAAVFFARFMFGMRVIAGPLAGVLRMNWDRFARFNVLGAATWVVTVSSLGYLFGQHWEQLLRLFRSASVTLGLLAAMLVIWLRRRYRGGGAPPGERGE